MRRTSYRYRRFSSLFLAWEVEQALKMDKEEQSAIR
jgi:hypothetical protein